MSKRKISIFVKFSSIFAVFLTVLGLGVSSTLRADEKDHYGVVGGYEAYSIKKDLYERGQKLLTGNEMIYIRGNQSAKVIENSIIAYCFNAELSVPDIDVTGDGKPFSDENVGENGFFPTYTKVASNEKLFTKLAKKPKSDAKLMEAVLKVVYNGYREGNDTRIQEIRDAFKNSGRAELNSISDEELYAATQKAVWYYTDSTAKQTINPKDLAIDEIGKAATMDEKAWYVYRFLLGDKNVPDSPLNKLTLKDYPKESILDLYQPNRVSSIGTNYQNLLSAKFVKPTTGNYKSFELTIKKIATDTNKELAGAEVNVSTKSGTALYSWKTGESNQNNNVKFYLPEGEYIFEEKSAPSGYLKAKPINFKVTLTGEVIVDGEPKADKTIVMEDKPTKHFTIKVTKLWQDKVGQEVPADTKDFLLATIKLKANGESAKDVSGNEVEPITLTRVNQWSGEFNNLPVTDEQGQKIEYTFEEESDPNYSLVENPTITVDGATANQDVKEVTLTNKEKGKEKSTISATKKWVGLKPAGEASTVTLILLKDGQADPEVKKIKEGESATWTIDKADLDKYSVVEVNEKNQPSQDNIIVLFGKKYDVDVKENKTADGKSYIFTNTYHVPKMTLKVEKNWNERPENAPAVYFKLVRKVKGVDKYEDVDQKELLKGEKTVIFSGLDVTDLSGVAYEYKTIEVNKDGSVWEHSADGYKSEKTKKLDVSKPYGVGNDTEVWTNTYTKPTAKVEKTVRFSKVAVNSTEELEDAHLKVVEGTSDKGKVAIDSKTKEALTWISGQNQKEFTLEAGTYTMVETQAPAGFLIADHITFTIDANGRITRADQVALENDTIVMKDDYKRHSIEISKQNLGSQELENAEIELFKSTADGKRGTRVDKWISKKEVHQLTLEEGDYIFVENTAPAGYEKVSDIHFSVKDGKVTVTKVGNSTEKDEISKTAKVDNQKDNKLIVIDQAKKHSIDISKVGLGGQELVGAVIEIRDEKGKTITDARTNELLRYTSTDQAKTVSLTAGTYVFHEETAPEGYKVVTDITFTVDDNGNIEVTKNTTTGNAEVKDGKLVVTDEVTSHPVVFSKVASLGGEELPNAQIIIYEEEGRKEVTRFTSTTKAHEFNLPMGTYIFHEEVAPEGYHVVTDITFTVDAKGKVTVTNVNGNTVEVTDNKLQVVDTAKVVEPKASDVHFSKQNLGGEEIVGAQIEIHNALGEVINKWTSTGTVQTISLLPGVYTFHEIAAPTGYVKVTAITFAVGQDGQVYILNGDGNKVSSDNNTMTVIDEAVAQPQEAPKGSLMIQKVDVTTNVVLEGAVFSVTGMITETTSTIDSSEIDLELTRLNEEITSLQDQLTTLQKAEEVDETLVNECQIELGLLNNKVADLLVQKGNLKPEVTSTVVAKDFGTVTTAKNGQAMLSELPDGEYTITEIQAPVGYDLDATPRKVVIKDGQTDVANNIVVVTNTKTVVPEVKFDISISKVDLGGAELAGAQIQLKQGDTIVHEWISTHTTHVVSLLAGRYTFHEVTAPTGYKVVTDIEFTVDEKGQVAIISAKGDEAKIVNNTLVVTDHKVPTDGPKNTPKDDPKDGPKDEPQDEPNDRDKVTSQVTIPGQSTSTSKKILPKTNSTESMEYLVAGAILLMITLGLFYKGKKKHHV
ncbi:SpaA isopeptide-forming pilin-related protein [Streptococcus ovis]|uniref:SpaA isopeptide-forming pilin-related protein n=1 Tax=Streptococcus ovis TaxID=82806 RepID=UPI000360BDB4|nr:SpaA isopeptide-forming pilin-related protein [Streptococcus ovis]